MSPPGKRALIITRSAEDFTATAAEFPGYDCLSAPCLEFVPVVGEALEARRALIPDGAALLVTSPRAVAAVAALVTGGRAAGGAISARMKGVSRVFALLPRTAREVEEALAGSGVPVEGVEGGAADLAAAATARLPGAALCLLTSQIGGEEAWRVRPDAIRVVVYETGCPARLPEAAERVLAGENPYGYEVLVASPSAVVNLERLWPGALAGAARLHVRGRTTGEAVAEVFKNKYPLGGGEG